MLSNEVMMIAMQQLGQVITYGGIMELIQNIIYGEYQVLAL